MGLLDILNHLLNFVAPAAAVSALLTLAGGWVGPKGRPAMAAWRRFALLFAVGVAMLAGGLVILGRDGKMLSYAALVLACASTQWALLRAWR